MRKIQLILALALMGLATLSGCTKKNDSTPSYVMSAKVGATTVNLTLCSAIVVANTLSITAVTVSGGTGLPPEINIYIPNWSGVAGTSNFTASPGTSDPFAQYVASTTSTSVSNSGSVTISSVSATSISGTFSFNCSDGTTTTSVTNGTFTAKR